MGGPCFVSSIPAVRCPEESISHTEIADLMEFCSTCEFVSEKIDRTIGQGHLLQAVVPSCTASDSADTGITGSQRAVAINSMIAAACGLRLSNDTLFLAVACLDKYLAAVSIPISLLQPLSVTCLWIAAKYESAVAPRAAVFAGLIRDTVSSTHSASTNPIKLLILLEISILKTLDYQLASIDTTKQCLRQLMYRIQANKADADLTPTCRAQQQEQLYSMMSYLAEVGLMEYQLLSTPPDQLAAAAYALAHVLLGRHPDEDIISQVCGYSFPQLQTPLQFLCALHTTLVQALTNGKPYAVSVKYSAPELHAVACVAPLCDASDPRLAF